RCRGRCSARRRCPDRARRRPRDRPCGASRPPSSAARHSYLPAGPVRHTRGSRRAGARRDRFPRDPGRDSPVRRPQSPVRASETRAWQMLACVCMNLRRSPIAGTWYPGSAPALTAAVDAHLARTGDVEGDLVALIAPHAGLMYSGPVAAHAYRLLQNRAFDVAVLVGPSHFAGFGGVAVYASGGFETPLGVAAIDADCAAGLVGASPILLEGPEADAR